MPARWTPNASLLSVPLPASKQRGQKTPCSKLSNSLITWNAFWCNGPVLCIRHGYEHPLGCVILIGGQRPQQGVWPFLHGMEARSHKTNQIKWSILQPVCNLALCCGFWNRGITWGPISKLQTGYYFSAYPWIYGTSTATYPHTLWQLNFGRNCKQHC